MNLNQIPRPEPPAGLSEQPGYQEQTALWVQTEFGATNLGDGRLTKRLVSTLQSFCSAPDASIPQASGSWAKTKGAYRLLNNIKITPRKILMPHLQATLSRVGEEKIVLAVQDTTALDYTHLPETEGMGNISQQPESRGMLVHSTLAFTPERVPLGLIHQLSWIRPPEEHGKKYQRHEKPIREKESYKWLASLEATEKTQRESPGTFLINIGDREADIYELFRQASEYTCKLLVRAAWDRRVDHPEKYLWPYMEAQPVAATLGVTVSRREKTPERTAEVELRFAPAEIKAPLNNKSPAPSVQVWVIYVKELSPPKDVEPLCWLLLTTLTIQSLEDAIKCVEYYAARYSIELFHKALKTGCKIEKRQLKTAEGLRCCLSIFSVVAWRIMFLTMLGRSVPHLPCTVLFEEHEWKSLYCFALKTKKPPAEPPALGEAMRLVAKLGGFLGRKSDGHPGIQVLWRGLKVLSVVSTAWLAFGPETIQSQRSS